MLIVTRSQAEEPKKEERPKSPGILAKLLAPFKGGEKKVKEKTKKSEKKEEVSRTRSMPFVHMLTSALSRPPLPLRPQLRLRLRPRLRKQLLPLLSLLSLPLRRHLPLRPPRKSSFAVHPIVSSLIWRVIQRAFGRRGSDN